MEREEINKNVNSDLLSESAMLAYESRSQLRAQNSNGLAKG